MKLRITTLIILLLGGTLPLAAADAKTEFTDLAGKLQHPLVTTGHKATVLVFVWQTCPVANAYAPEIERIYQAYKDRGVAMYLVQVDPDLKLEKARDMRRNTAIRCPC